MKYIFDFDDVLLHSTKHRKEHMYLYLEKLGIKPEAIEEYYKRERVNLFSLRKLLAHFSVKKEVYEEMMSDIKYFSNDKLLEIIKKLGKDNCYIITYGDEEFNRDKITYSGVGDLFRESHIFIVSGSKKELLEQICAKHKDEEILFIDDKPHNFEGLDLKKCSNLKTILYTGQNLDYII